MVLCVILRNDNLVTVKKSIIFVLVVAWRGVAWRGVACRDVMSFARNVIHHLPPPSVRAVTFELL